MTVHDETAAKYCPQCGEPVEQTTVVYGEADIIDGVEEFEGEAGHVTVEGGRVNIYIHAHREGDA